MDDKDSKSDLHDVLDEMMTRPTITRKASVEPKPGYVWNPFDQIWEENDQMMRDKLKKINK